MNISVEKSKEQFDILEWKNTFQTKGFAIPNNDDELRAILMSKKPIFPMKFITNKLISKLGCEDDADLEKLCGGYTKECKIDKFFELFDVIYPTAAAEPVVEPEQPVTAVPEETTETSKPAMIEIGEQFSLTEAQDFFDENNSKLEKDETGRIDSKKWNLTENKAVTVSSKFWILCKVDAFDSNNVLILDKELKNVIAVGRIVSQEGKLLVTMEKENIKFSEFRNKMKFNMGILKKENDTLTGEIIYKEVRIEMHEVKETEDVLCIDFGTSNTTAGKYVRTDSEYEPQLVTFADITQDNKCVDHFPTIVYIADCEDATRIKYKFGFEAKALEKKGNYESSASVFYQIKQWLMEDSDYPEDIKVCDDEGNSALVSKKSIVKAYIEHVIALAEDYFDVKFKNLHFTAPVKMKSKFITTLKELIPDYTIKEGSKAIDEAGAVLFDYVANKFIEWKKTKKKENRIGEGNVAVIDCGGGTTDLATCEYTFEDESTDTTPKPKKITIHTQFTNGDFNYGGNNITYRIMQLIKMKIAVKDGFISAAELNKVLERSENDILSYADACTYDSEQLYQDYNKLYFQCEKFLPTQFNDEELFDSVVPKVKRNFYYLWQFAEQVKIIFYREEKEVKRDEWDDALQLISNLKQSKNKYLYKWVDETLVEMDNVFEGLEITITEIRKAIFGDIYILLNKILNLDNGRLEPVYDYYKLSGQSCKINLFNELLKEFIPGRKLRHKMEKRAEHVESISLKKHCIYGSIRYMMYTQLSSSVELAIKPAPSKQIYAIFFKDIGDRDTLAKKSDNTLTFMPIKPDLEELSVLVKEKDSQKVVRNIKVSTSKNNFEPLGLVTNVDDVMQKLNHGVEDIDWDETGEKLANYGEEDGTTTFMVAVPAGEENGYGFFVHLVLKKIENTESCKKETYQISKGKYYNYEATSSNFFDGKVKEDEKN